MSGRKIVITGVTRGLGLALTKELIKLGHVVAGCGRSEEAILALQKEFPAPHEFCAVDVSSDEQVAAWAKRVLGMFGPPDFLLNNAALINANAPLWKVPSEEFSTVIDVNIKGVANVIRHFAPAMVARNSGVIVNFSSGWGRATDADVAPYCATKWAIEGLTQALAQELPSGMAAVALNPGIIDTEMLRSCFGKSAGAYDKPEEWVTRAAPYILGISRQNADSRTTVP
jgi:NAD(P)-dependent dehydrogenase (short-subunit alcohol dehydrogenase family)